MKFLFSADLRRNAYLRVLLICYFIFILIFLCGNPFYEFFRFGLTPEAVRNSVLGNEELYISAQDLVTLVSEMHIHLFLYSLAILTTLSVFVHVGISERIKLSVAFFLTGAVLTDSLSTLGVRYLFPWLAWLKVIGFWSVQLGLGVTVLIVLHWLSRRPDAATR